MPAVVKHLAPKPIVLVAISVPFNPLADGPRMMAEGSALIEKIPGEVYQIVDVSQWDISFDKLLDVLAGARGGVATESRVHVVLVGSGNLVQLGVAAMKQKQYGGIQAQLFTSQEQALAYIDGQVARV